MTDEDGTVVSTIKYYPFGLTREQSGALPTDKLFTGQQKEPDDVLELYHYNARIYSAAMGRFLSVDPIASSGQRLNPYSYVLNNPLKYIDPSGMCLPDINCPGDVDVEPVPDPYVEQAAAEDWVNAPPMQPGYEPCEECIAWQAAALAYQAAATEVTALPSFEEGACGCGSEGESYKSEIQLLIGAPAAGQKLCGPWCAFGATVAAAAIVDYTVIQNEWGDDIKDLINGDHDEEASEARPKPKSTPSDADHVPAGRERKLTAEEVERLKVPGISGHDVLEQVKEGYGARDAYVDKDTGEILIPRQGGGFTRTGSFVPPAP